MYKRHLLIGIETQKLDIEYQKLKIEKLQLELKKGEKFGRFQLAKNHLNTCLGFCVGMLKGPSVAVSG